MSRIFDALRKSELEKTGKSSFTPWKRSARESQATKVREQELPATEANNRVVPRITPERHVFASGDSQTPSAERFRVLRHRLQKIRSERPLKKLLVCSAVPREGKTLIAVNLALSLAKTSPHVLLIDADLRQSGVHKVLGLTELPGLGELLEGKIDERAATRRLAEPWNLYYMPAGRPTAAPGELLQGPRMSELLKQAGEKYEWVVVDSAPLSLFADTPHLATLTDGSLLVTRLGVTPAAAIPNSLAALEGNFIAGIVMNGDEDAASDRYGHYYSLSSTGDVEDLVEVRVEASDAMNKD